MKKPTVIFSGMAGSGKTSLAKEIAKRLGLKYLCGGDALKELAAKHGYKISDSDWWETKEGMKFLAERKSNPEFDKEVDRILLERAKAGGVAITSWALPWLGAPGVKIWVDASAKVRAMRISKRDGSSLPEATEAVKKRDRENLKLYKKMYGFSLEKDPAVFDIIIDSNDKSVTQLADEIEIVLKGK